MRKLSKLFVALMVCVLAVGGLFSMAACGGGETEKDTIAVMAKGESHAFWLSVRSGAEAAGEEMGYRITFRGPASEQASSVPEQLEQVTSALTDSRTAAMVLATIGEGFGSLLQSAADNNIPIVEFDSGIYNKDEIPDPSPVVSSVATSNVLAAALAAENFYTTLKPLIEATAEGSTYKVGIIQHDASQTGIDRANGFNDKIKELAEADGLSAKLETQIQQGEEQRYGTILDTLRTWGAQAIFMCNEGVVKECYASVTGNADLYKDLLFCGFDAGTAQQDWIKDEGATYAHLVGSVAQDSYQIGYQAVMQAAKYLKNEQVETSVAISGVWYNAENLDQMKEDNIVYDG